MLYMSPHQIIAIWLTHKYGQILSFLTISIQISTIIDGQIFSFLYMNISNYLDKMKVIQKCLLKFIKKSSDLNSQQIFDAIDKENIVNNQFEFKSFIYLLSSISNNYHRTEAFHSKIEHILANYKNHINKYFSNIEIFNIFKKNKRIILFLFNEKILIFDQQILKKISNKKYDQYYYCQYFRPEIKALTNCKRKSRIDPEKFEEKRRIGENDLLICELIRNDSIKEFIKYVNKTNLSLNTEIEPSIFETHPFLIKNKNHSLIEYASFFGAIQIFQYLRLNGVELTPSIWNYSIHSNNPEIIHLLEENQIKCNNNTIINESIKCHHNKIVNYFLNMASKNIQNFYPNVLKHYNFQYIQNDSSINKTYFYDFCKNDYIIFAQDMLPYINANEIKDIQKVFTYIDIFGYEASKITLKKETALYAAVDKEKIDIVKLLLTSQNIDVNTIIESNPDNWILPDQKTALTRAVENENIEIIKLLLSCASIDVNILTRIITEKGTINIQTALHIAIEIENAEIVKLLLSSRNIDVNYYMTVQLMDRFEYTEKKTPLCLAIEKDNIEIAYLLLSLCHNINIFLPFVATSSNGCNLPKQTYILKRKTPLQMASDQNNQTICQLIMMKYPSLF